MATQFGTQAPFGIPHDQTGIIIDGRTEAHSTEKKIIRTRQGQPTGSTYYGDQTEITLSGFLPTSTPFAGTVAAAITLGTAVTKHTVANTSATTIVEGVTRTLSSEEYSRIEITANNTPGIAA